MWVNIALEDGTNKFIKVFFFIVVIVSLSNRRRKMFVQKTLSLVRDSNRRLDFKVRLTNELEKQ